MMALLPLRNALADAYPEPAQARTIAEEFGLPVGKIEFSVAANDFWTNVLKHVGMRAV